MLEQLVCALVSMFRAEQDSFPEVMERLCAFAW